MKTLQFQATTPQWTGLVSSDTREAWTGAWPGQPELPLRVEAAVTARSGQPQLAGLTVRAAVVVAAVSRPLEGLVEVTVQAAAARAVEPNQPDQRRGV